MKNRKISLALVTLMVLAMLVPLTPIAVGQPKDTDKGKVYFGYLDKDDRWIRIIGITDDTTVTLYDVGDNSTSTGIKLVGSKTVDRMQADGWQRPEAPKYFKLVGDKDFVATGFTGWDIPLRSYSTFYPNVDGDVFVGREFIFEAHRGTQDICWFGGAFNASIFAWEDATVNIYDHTNTLVGTYNILANKTLEYNFTSGAVYRVTSDGDISICDAKAECQTISPARSGKLVDKGVFFGNAPASACVLWAIAYEVPTYVEWHNLTVIAWNNIWNISQARGYTINHTFTTVGEYWETPQFTAVAPNFTCQPFPWMAESNGTITAGSGYRGWDWGRLEMPGHFGGKYASYDYWIWGAASWSWDGRVVIYAYSDTSLTINGTAYTLFANTHIDLVPNRCAPPIIWHIVADKALAIISWTGGGHGGSYLLTQPDVANINPFTQPFAKLYVGKSANPNVFDPLNDTAPPACENVTVYVKARNISDLLSMDFYMNYDPTYLEVLNDTYMVPNVDYGASWGTVLVHYVGVAGTVNNTSGKIEGYSAARIAGTISGNLTLFKIKFHVKAALPTTIPRFSTLIKITDKPIVMLNSAEEMIYLDVNDGVLWGPIPPPPSAPTAIINENTTWCYVGDTINLWSTSLDASDGIHIIPINREDWNITDSLNVNVLSVSKGRHSSINFTPTYADTYTVLLEVWATPNPGMDYDSATADKLVLRKVLTGVDCFTNKGRMCGYEAGEVGFGPNMPADAYTVDELVTLYAYVVYNGWPKAGFLVSFEVYDAAGQMFVLKQNMTDQSGIAWIRFRIPTPTEPHLPYSKVFGKWLCFQKVKMSDEYYYDTLMFDVGWIVELLNVTAVKLAFTYPEHMNFIIWVRNIAMRPRYVVFSLEVYDDEDVPIALYWWKQWIDGGKYCVPYDEPILVECIPIPKWFYPGTGKVIVNAWFNDIPTKCGHCCCPAISATFTLLAPPVPPPDPGW